MKITDSKLMCDFEDCGETVSVSESDLGSYVQKEEHALFAKANREGWVCSEDGAMFYCPEHTIAGIKIGNKFK